MGIWSSFVVLIENALLFFNDILLNMGAPFSFGFSIILFTFIVKTLTYPLNLKQMRSARATQVLQPKLKELQKKHGDDRQALAQAQMELYKEAGVNPLGGCLPMLVQMPIWFALYRALYNLAGENQALKDGFFWVPSLSGPALDPTAGISWLNPGAEAFVGWGDATGYLVLPVLLVVSQLFYQRMITPPSTDPQQRTMQQVMMFMPFMFGYFSLIVPAGLTLYWFTNNILSMIQQYFINRSTVLPTLDAEETKKSADTANGKESSAKDKGKQADLEQAVLENVEADEEEAAVEQVQINGRPKSKSRSGSRNRSRSRRKRNKK